VHRRDGGVLKASLDELDRNVMRKIVNIAEFLGIVIKSAPPESILGPTLVSRLGNAFAVYKHLRA
jgi:hypothetical protein